MNFSKIKTLILTVFLLNATLLSAQDSSIKVMSFNIHYGSTVDNVLDIYRTAKVIVSANPDVVMLQEVDVKTKRSQGQDLIEELSKLTGMKYVFGKSIDYKGGQFGNAILSKYPIIKSEVYLLAHTKGTEQRSALEAFISLDSGDTIRIVGTHLDQAKDGSLRSSQTGQISKLFTDDIPTILAGDFNTTPSTEEIDVLLKSWNMSFSKSSLSFPSDVPRIKIDYILSSPLDRWYVISNEVILGEEASDHLPIMATLKLLKEKK